MARKSGQQEERETCGASICTRITRVLQAAAEEREAHGPHGLMRSYQAHQATRLLEHLQHDLVCVSTLHHVGGLFRHLTQQHMSRAHPNKRSVFRSGSPRIQSFLRVRKEVHDCRAAAVTLKTKTGRTPASKLRTHPHVRFLEGSSSKLA